MNLLKRLVQSKYKIYSDLYKKVKNPHKKIISILLQPEIKKTIKEIKNYQIMNDKINVDFNYIKENFPESLYTGMAYRGLVLPMSKLDINNLEQSIRNNIYSNELESWSKSKSFVDNFKKALNINIRRIKNPIVIKLKANIEGLDISKFFEEMEKEYNVKNYNIFDNEEEILTSTPNNYEIYNLDEIRKNLEKIPKVVKKFGFW